MEDRIYRAFDAVHADKEMVARVKQKIGSKAVQGNRRSLRRGRLIAACAAVSLILGITALYHIQSIPVSYISIDVNPSIELSLNRWDRIIEAYAFNEEGREILELVSVKGREAERAVELILTSEAIQPYLLKDADLTFTIASEDAGKRQSLYDMTGKCSAGHGYAANSCFASMDLISEAHENDLSFGKYSVYLELCEYDNTITAEDCRHMSMAQMHGMLGEQEADGHHGSSGHGKGGCHERK